MKAGPPNDSPQNKRLDENDPMNDLVWRLLARAPRPEPDAWFAVRTLARCRHEGSRVESGVGSLVRFARMWRWALGGGLALSMAVALVVTQINSEKADKQKNVQEAFEIMASIDTDSDSSSSSSWQDSSL
jgi:hypothetical protein